VVPAGLTRDAKSSLHHFASLNGAAAFISALGDVSVITAVTFAPWLGFGVCAAARPGIINNPTIPDHAAIEQRDVLLMRVSFVTSGERRTWVVRAESSKHTARDTSRVDGRRAVTLDQRQSRAE
jgi:hypothetical protein